MTLLQSQVQPKPSTSFAPDESMCSVKDTVMKADVKDKEKRDTEDTQTSAGKQLPVKMMCPPGMKRSGKVILITNLIIVFNILCEIFISHKFLRRQRRKFLSRRDVEDRNVNMQRLCTRFRPRKTPRLSKLLRKLCLLKRVHVWLG